MRTRREIAAHSRRVALAHAAQARQEHGFLEVPSGQLTNSQADWFLAEIVSNRGESMYDVREVEITNTDSAPESIISTQVKTGGREVIAENWEEAGCGGFANSLPTGKIVEIKSVTGQPSAMAYSGKGGSFPVVR